MKKIFQILTCVGLSIPAFAQPTLKLGPEFGGTYVTMNQKRDGNTYNTNYQLGMRIGAVADLQFNDYFYLQSGLFLSLNNGTESYYDRYYRTGAGLPTSDHDRRNYSINYLNLPVYAMYKTGKEFDDPHFFIGVGPYFSWAVNGNFKQTYTNTLNGQDRTKRYDMSMPFGNSRSADELRRFDFGASATLGYELPIGLYFRAHYSIGLINVAPDGDSDNCLRNMGGGLSVGWLFRTSSKPHWQ